MGIIAGNLSVNTEAFRMKGLRKNEKTDLKDAQDGVCENCGKETKVRKIEVLSSISKASRGWYNFCYKCVGPRILWKKGRMEMESPMNIPFNELDTFLANYFSEGVQKEGDQEE